MNLKRTASDEASTSQPYPPSWVDRFTGWVNRLPLPPWLLYLSLWVLLAVVESAARWLDGVQPAGRIWQVNFFYTFYGLYFLAAIHYLDAWAEKAFETFRPTLEVDQAR